MTGITIRDKGVVGTSFNSLEWFMTGITIRDKEGGGGVGTNAQSSL